MVKSGSIRLAHPLLLCLIIALFVDVSSLPVQVPGPAPNLQAVSNSPTSVSLSWDKPLTGNGELLTYKLYYTDKSVGNEQVRFLFVPPPPSGRVRVSITLFLNECFPFPLQMKALI